MKKEQPEPLYPGEVLNRVSRKTAQAVEESLRQLIDEVGEVEAYYVTAHLLAHVRLTRSCEELKEKPTQN
jgi:hypothetical protein